MMNGGDGMLQWAKGTTGGNAGRPRSLDVQAGLLLDVLDGTDVDTCCVRFSPSGRLVRALRPGDSRFVRLYRARRRLTAERPLSMAGSA